MKNTYWNIEKSFQRLTSVVIVVMGNSITFAVVLGTLVFWFSSPKFYTQDNHELVRDVILGINFLSLFIIQKAFNRFSASLHLKVNELLFSHEPASNSVIDAEKKTEKELSDLSKEYTDLAKKAKEEIEEKIKEVEQKIIEDVKEEIREEIKKEIREEIKREAEEKIKEKIQEVIREKAEERMKEKMEENTKENIKAAIESKIYHV
jgi:low affinity Fe/Cu permease